MKTPFPVPPPISNLARWALASLANIVHLLDQAHTTAATPLPDPAHAVPAPAAMHVWGDVFASVGNLLLTAFVQAGQAFTAHPWLVSVKALAFVWLCIESLGLVRKARAWLRSVSHRDEPPAGTA